MHAGDGRIPIHRRFSVRTFVALVTLSILSVSVTFVSLYLLTSSAMRQNVSQRNLQIARRASEEINLYLEDSFNYLESLSDMLMPVKDPWVVDIILESSVVTYGKFKRIHLLDSPDEVKASSELDNSRVVYDRDLAVRAAESRSISFSDVFLSSDGLPYMSVAISVDSAYDVWPVIYADLQLRDIWDLVDDISFGESGNAYLISRQNVLIAHPDKARVLSVDQDAFLGSDEGAPDGSYFVTNDESGTRYLAASDDIQVLGWRIVIIQLLSEAFVPLRTILVNFGIIALLAFLAAVGTSLLLARRYSGPLTRLMSGTDMIREGTFNHRIEIENDDEFGRLSRSFNSMVSDLGEWSDKLADSEKKYRLLTENVNDIIFSLDGEGRILYCNNKVVSVTGYTIEELCGKAVGEFLTEDSSVAASDAIEQGSPETNVEIELLTRSGSTVSLEAKLVKSVDSELGVTYYGVARDITERKKAEASLVAYQNELRSLASQLMLTEARERQKIASMIHDRIGQALSLSRIKLGILNSYGLPDDGAKIVGEIIPVIEQIIQETRSLIFTISSPLLYDLGLGAALERLVEQFHEEHPIVFRYYGPETAPEIEIDISLLLFDAVKELLVNTVKHSRARAVTVTLRTGRRVDISVRDDGDGFDESLISNGRGAGGGYGLFSIRERLSNIGGSCVIHSRRGEGSQILLKAPTEGRIQFENTHSAR